MMTANYHTHTARCPQAVGSDEEYVLYAIDAGIKTLGFADHCPYPGFDGDYYSGYRMYCEDLGDYCESVRSLREKYKGQIKILLGLETEYYPRLFKGLLDFIRPYGVEYLILGQHYLDDDQYGVWTREAKSEDELIKYVDQCCEALSTGLFSYIAHPDIVGFDRSLPEFEREMRRLARFAKKLSIPVEINLLGISSGRDYPCEEFFRIAGEEGCTAILGRDAHIPKEFYNTEAYEKALSLAEKCGLEITEEADFSRLERYFKTH